MNDLTKKEGLERGAFKTSVKAEKNEYLTKFTFQGKALRNSAVIYYIPLFRKMGGDWAVLRNGMFLEIQY